ncbi:M48 family metalloprotease [Paracoccus sp. TK19116]|uniref:M48 family metalloprotease n=1 Tax=Paracoccus albicereus TaxID=2922394 RepID=A0ABT1MS98_9RHOB|nr:M48 family metalloprotease [Paracoccus albicereus]MCQ0971173.1 M48 family metalloprotease [Paracoccus albicereus]
MAAWGGKAILAAVLALSGCVAVPQDGTTTAPGRTDTSTDSPYSTPAAASGPTVTGPLSARAAARNFVSVMQRMEPAIERECQERRTQSINCDFQFVVDDRAGQDINAFQTVDPQGRPIIGFTLPLIAEARNADEMAFVVGHEASHHILNHLSQKSGAATAGAIILGGLAGVYSGNPAAVASAQRIGASVGSRYYSREWELQADYLGAIITLNAGLDPRNGARFFERIPDPGNRVLGSHPSRAARIAQVERAVEDYRSGRAR